LYNAHNDCGESSNIEKKSLNEFGNEEFHNIRVWEVSVENASTTNQT
jgi:hypothetical protein